MMTIHVPRVRRLLSALPRRERSLPVRIHLVVLVLAALVPVLSFSVLVVGRLADHERAAVERGLRETAQALATSVDREIRGSMNTLEALARSSHLLRADFADFHAELRRVVPTQPGWRHVFLADRQGRSVLSSAVGFGDPLPAVDDREYWQDVVSAGQAAISDLLISRLTGGPQLVIAVPVVVDGETQFVLCAALDPAVLSGILTEQQFPADWTAALLDRRQTIIVRSRALDQHVGQSAPAAFAEAVRRSPRGSGFVEATTGGGPRTYAAFTRAPLSGWTVVLGMPPAAAFASGRQTLLLIGASGLFFLSVSIALGLLAGRQISGAIRSLADVAARRAGASPDRLAVAAVREVNEVGRALVDEIAERRRAEGRAEALVEISHALAQSLDPQIVAERSAASLRDLLGTETSSVHRLDPLTGSLVLLAGEPLVVTDVTELALAQRAPVATPDATADPRIPVTPPTASAPAPYRALLSVPLLIGDEGLGVLSVGDATGRRFTDEEIALAQAFADHAALAMANAELMQRLRTHRADLEAVLETSRQLVAVQPLPSLLARIAERCGQLLSADSVTLRLLEDDELVMAASWGDPRSAGNLRIKVGERLTGRVAASGAPLIVEDLAVETPELPGARADLLRLGYRAWLGVPVTIAERLIGVLALRSLRPRAFSSEEVSIAVAFASQAAVAVNNARLYADATRRRDEAEAVARAARVLTETLDVAGVGQRIVETVHEILGTRTSVLRLLAPDGSLRAVAFGGRMRGQLSAGHVTPPGVGVGSLAVATGRPAWSSDALNDPRFRVTDELRQGFDRFEIRSVLSVPLLAKGQVIGVLDVGDVADRVFTDSEISLLQTLADHAAAAVENTRLYEEARTALEALSRTQEQLLQAQKMDAVGRLAGGIAHDFNNLLTVILGRAQLLLEQVPSDHALRRHVSLIETTSLRASGLVRQLLAFSRKQVLQPRVLDLNVVVAELMTLLERVVREDIEIVVRPGARLGRVKADPSQVEQVILNLVVNARDAMPVGGRLTIETANLELAAAGTAPRPELTPGSYVRLTISDTGIGMDRTTQQHIFEPFFTTKDVGEGTGLGLAMVYGIVKQSGGDIAVRSEPGRGTAFEILLPRVDVADDSTADAAPAGAARPGTGTVLLVEDEDEVRALTREILQDAGYAVLDAGRPDDAVRLAREHAGAIDLLLTDVVMPGRDGPTLARSLGPLQPKMRVVYMSGYPDGPKERAGLLDGSSTFIAKPFTPAGLLTRIRDTLSGPILEPA